MGDVVNRNVYVGFYALGVTLAFLFNVVVIVVIVIVIIKHPTLRASSLPKFLTVLVCSLAQLTIAAWLEAPYLHAMRSLQMDMSCTASLARYLGWRILPSFSMLTVAVAILTEVMRLVKMRQTRRMVITISLLMIAAVYSLATTLTIHYLKILRYPENPCGEDTYFPTENEFGYWNRIEMASVYAPPAVVIFISNFLLVIASIIIRRTSSTAESVVSSERGPLTSRPSGRDVVGSNQSTSGDVVQAHNDMQNLVPGETIDRFPTAVPRATSITDNKAISVASFPEQPPLAVDLLLAGIVTNVLNFPVFYYLVFWYDAEQSNLDPEYNTQDLKFTLSANFVSMFWLALVPCCWLLGAELRACVRNIIRCARAGTVASNYYEMTSEN